MAISPKKGLFESVRFYWFSDDGREALDGTVRIGDGEMVLDIKGDNGPYLIEGNQREHWFEGMNTLTTGGRVEAHWAWLGEGFAGRWLENGKEYLLWFTLHRGG